MASKVTKTAIKAMAKELLNGLSYGDKTYARQLRNMQDGEIKRVDYWMNTLMRRVESGFLAYDKHQLAIAGVRWSFVTGRVPTLKGWYSSLSLNELLELLAEIILRGYTWQDGKGMEEVASFLRTIKVEEAWDAESWTLNRKRVA